MANDHSSFVEQIKSLCKSKTNIIFFFIPLFSFLQKAQDLLVHFSRYLILIVITAVVILIFLIINILFFSKSSSNNNNSIENSEAKPIRVNIISRIVFGLLLFIIFLTGTSLITIYKIKDLNIYFVVVKNNLTLNNANQLREKTNTSSAFRQANLSTRILKTGYGTYELILNNGYLTQKKALEDKVKLMAISTEFSPYVVGPQKNSNYWKKIRYIQYHAMSLF